MSVPRIPEPARLIVSILAVDEARLDPVRPKLTEQLGPLEEEIGPLPFDFTSYYDKEMGTGIKRRLWVFSNLVDAADLVEIKLFSNELEQQYSEDGCRAFNLDPGLMTLGNFVLATGKNNAHRIYLGKGIFGDLTLIYRSGTYRPLEWTYPDYADTRLIDILNALREKYKCKLTREAT
ncbi:MAG: DUF4416 family protein [Desulfomonilaceae bacterium]|nr:DUF4416 family protein [Desulfomonilaceae bacterium]